MDGKEKVIDTLLKDLTRSAGGSLANKLIDEVMTAIKKTRCTRREHHGSKGGTAQYDTGPRCTNP